MTNQCKLCGNRMNTIKFKENYVCEECLDYVRRQTFT